MELPIMKVMSIVYYLLSNGHFFILIKCIVNVDIQTFLLLCSPSALKLKMQPFMYFCSLNRYT